MKISNFHDLYAEDYQISRLFAMDQKWDNQKVFDVQNRKTSGLVYFQNSSGLYHLEDGRQLIAPKGSIWFLPQGSTYQCTFFSGTAVKALCRLVEFSLQDSSGDSFSIYDQVTAVGSDEHALLPELFAEVLAEYNRPVFSPPLLKAAVYHLIAQTARQSRQQSIASRQLESIQPAIAFLERNHLPENGVAQLAQMCHMSEVSFRKKFREYAGMTPSVYILNQKLQRAKRLLRSGSYTVAEAAEASGFDDPSYFSKVFKKQVGLLPGAYARQH